MPRSDRERVGDIIEACDRILRYVNSSSKKEFHSDDLIVDAVIRNLTVIGEAASKIGRTIREKYPDVEWSEMIGMRNIVVHDYFGVDKNILWQTVSVDIPALRSALEGLFKEL